MSNAFSADQQIRKLLDLLRLPLYNKDLETRIVIEMGVRGGDDHVVMVMLQIHQLVGQEPRMMVVDKCDGSHDLCFRRFDGSTHQPIANEVTKCFGPVGVALSRDEMVKAGQKIGINRNSRPD
jgi:hypothetical protein